MDELIELEQMVLARQFASCRSARSRLRCATSARATATVTPSLVGVMTSVYVRRDDQWKLAVYQQTPKP